MDKHTVARVRGERESAAAAGYIGRCGGFTPATGEFFKSLGGMHLDGASAESVAVARRARKN